MMGKRSAVIGAGAVLAACLLSLPAANLYYRSSWGEGCARCHEIRIDYNAWHASAHRNINCVECHASGTMRNLHRVAAHLKGEAPEQIHLGADDVFAMLPRCEGCHRAEFAEWRSGAHS